MAGRIVPHQDLDVMAPVPQGGGLVLGVLEESHLNKPGPDLPRRALNCDGVIENADWMRYQVIPGESLGAFRLGGMNL